MNIFLSLAVHWFVCSTISRFVYSFIRVRLTLYKLVDLTTTMLYTFRILKVPAAFVPIALNQPDSSKMKLLQHLHISIIVVHTKLLQVRIIIDEYVCTIDCCMVTKTDEIIHFKCYPGDTFVNGMDKMSFQVQISFLVISFKLK